MTVRILVDEGLIGKSLVHLKNELSQFNIVPTFHFCKIHSGVIGTDQLIKWVRKNIGDKTLIITPRQVSGSRDIKTGISYRGYAESLGGQVAFATVGKDKDINPNLCLHEIFHLYGLQHCNKRGCIMGFKLCNRELKYCAICLKPCIPLHLCKTCGEGLSVYP